MKYTTNYNLKKPEGTDTVNIDDLNANADILDNNINSIREQINDLDVNKADLVNGKVSSEQLPNIEVPVQSVNSKTGVVILTKSDIGLGSVDNTADTNKNVLSATKLTTARTINGVAFDGTANITIADNTKAPTNHASTGSTYGLGTTANYGHVKTINALTQSSHVDGTALSAYQGYVLKGLIDYLAPPIPLVYSGTTPINGKIEICAIDITKYKHLSINTGYEALYELVIVSSNLYLIGLYERSENDRANVFTNTLVSDSEVTIVDTNFNTPYYTVKRSGNLLIVYHVNNYTSVQEYKVTIY